jgi:hypothetical protein
MNFKYAGYLLKAAAMASVFLFLSTMVSAKELKVTGKTVTQVEEPVRPAPEENAFDAKMASMPNPVTAYPVDNGYSVVTWETLAGYAYDTPTIEEQRRANIRQRKKQRPIPKYISELNGTKVAITGFMLPMDVDATGENAMAFVIVRSRMSCCYGIVPKLNEWVEVTMANKGKTRIVMDVPFTVYGTLEAGEKYEEQKGWTLYRMTGEKTKVPQNFKLW